MKKCLDEFVRRARQRRCDLVLERTDISCADPRLRPIRVDVMNTVIAGLQADHKPADIARRLRMQFPHVSFNWAPWVGDEIVIAIARSNVNSLAAMSLPRYDWMPSPDCCDRCRALEAGGPYPVGAGPLPVLDSHSGCLCVLAGRAD